MRMSWKLAVAMSMGALAWAQPGPGGPGGGSAGDGIWRRNAYYGELLTFDACVGHQPGGGNYHYHANPLCLRAQLNDNVTTLRNSRDGSSYAELSSGWHHSPILGWALDGYPIYGPYGYSNPADSASPVRRVVSGFQLRNITQRSSLPTWSLPNHANISQSLTTTQYGPPVSTTFPLGRYVEDYDWVSSAGDLDQYNGRFTVTPEFPNGTYAYFVTIDANGAPAFPYIVAGQYYGTTGSGFSTTGTSSATTYFKSGIYSTGPSTPEMTSWVTKHSIQYAQVVSGYDPSAGPSTTWPGTNNIGAQTMGAVTVPTLAETQQIQYSNSTVYVTSNGMAGYTMGPWFSADMTGGVFQNFPNANSVTFQMPSSPSQATATHSNTGMGPQGMWVNGVVMFNFLDGASYINSTGLDSMAGNTPALDAAVTSAASFEQGPQAPGSLVSAFPLFFATLSTNTANVTTATWPTTLGGASISVKDSTGVTMSAPISYASPTQLNFLLPSGLATGAGAVTITAGSQIITSKINIQPVYPNLFMGDATAIAAGSVVRIHNGTATTSTITADAIALNGDQLYLTLYGSGLGSATSATATVGGVAATVSYAGPQGTYTGLDQYNILLPSAVAGMGKVNVIVTAGGKPSNPVNVTVQ
jgi:uncharacterized protein (TIGR03437 family)